MEKDDRKLGAVLGKETTRRGFLKSAGAVAGAAVAAGKVTGVRPAQAAQAAAPQEKPLMKYLFAERQNCTGCRACEYACTMYHEGVVRPALSRVHVIKYKGIVDVPVICHHCDDAPCIESCPTDPKAIQKDSKTGGIKLDPELCLGAKLV